jgi:hypothetical protein
MPNLHDLSPQQQEQLPVQRDDLTKSFKEVVDTAMSLAGTSNFHLAGLPRLATEATATFEENGANGVVVPLVLMGVDGTVFEFRMDKSEALAFAIDILRCLQ